MTAWVRPHPQDGSAWPARNGPPRVLMPRLVDALNVNAQNLNAKSMLARFDFSACRWIAAHYGEPDAAVAGATGVELVRLWRGRRWPWRLMLLYQQRVDAIAYPGVEWADDWGLRLRSRSGRSVPIVATLEGLVGDEARERQLATWAGHPVYCQRIAAPRRMRAEWVLRQAARVVAISPFLAEMGKKLYGDKFVACPLGLEPAVFHARGRTTSERVTVVGAGGVHDGKRVRAFVHLARRFPEAQFTWFGSGPLEEPLRTEAAASGLTNLRVVGPVGRLELADAFRRADVFVLPSHAEGAPKVVQEAAACGLAVVVFGFYETPAVVDGVNGYVVWNDEQLVARVGEFVADRAKAAAMGACGAEMAASWDWSRVAPLWESEFLSVLAAGPPPSFARHQV